MFISISYVIIIAYLYRVDYKQFQIIKIVDNFKGNPNYFQIEDDVIVSLQEFLSKNVKVLN